MFGIDRELSVGLVGSPEDRRNFHTVFAGVGCEDDAPPPHPLAVMPLPLDALQGLHVTPKRVFGHFFQPLEDEVLIIPRDLAKLSCGGF